MTKPRDSRYRKIQLDRGRKVVEWYGVKFSPVGMSGFHSHDEVQLLEGSTYDCIVIAHSVAPEFHETWDKIGIVGGTRNYSRAVLSWGKVGPLPSLEAAQAREEKSRGVTRVPVDSVKVLESIMEIFPVRVLGSAIHVESCLDGDLQAQFERALSRSFYKHQLLEDGTMLVWK